VRADAEANLDRVLSAAEAVFAEHGLDVSIDLVAKRAGVWLGTIYRRFANKEALIAELVRRLLADVVEIAERHVADPDGSGLVNYLYEVSELLAGNRGALARLWNEPGTRELVARSRKAQGELLARAQEHRAVNAHLTKEDVAVGLWSVQGVLDVTRGLSINAWRRHVDILVAGFRDHGWESATRSLTHAQMTKVIHRA
jgi:AcrR family transcriptional regulator